jgi:RND family efflux transporter MFP subunit
MSPDGHPPDPQKPGPGVVDAPAPDLGFALPPPGKLTPGRALLVIAVVVVVLVSAFLAAYLPRRQAQADLAQGTHAASHAALRVNVVTPKVMTSDRALLLPGAVTPLLSTVIYPRANGYLRKWYVDIGDKVKDGQLLAEIETPEVDQQLMQARAQLVQADESVLQAVANREFSKANLARYVDLLKSGLASQQDLDQHRAQADVDEASVAVAKANVVAMRANISRLEQLTGFGRVTAPFAGTITSRSIDVGALVTATNTTPLFNLVAMDPARVFIQVPQDVAPSVRADVPADVTVREYPGRIFHGTVARAAGALDPQSRTMNTEVRVVNADNALFAGMYAEVSLTLPSPHKVYEVPATALFNDAQGLRLAIVGSDDKVKLVKVTLERDTGSTVLISTGLSGSERIVKLANAGLSDGTDVDVVPQG